MIVGPKKGITCSLRSVSSFNEADNSSFTSPLIAAGGGVGVFLAPEGPFKEGLRAVVPFKDEDTRGVLTAERAVAPFVIEFGGELARGDDVRREFGGVARPARGGEVAVAINRIKSL